MPASIDTRIASAVVVLVWVIALATVEMARRWPAEFHVAIIFVAGCALATARRIPIRRVPLAPIWHPSILFILPVALSVGAALSMAGGSRKGSWAIIAATFIAVGRLKDALNSGQADPSGN